MLGNYEETFEDSKDGRQAYLSWAVDVKSDPNIVNACRWIMQSGEMSSVSARTYLLSICKRAFRRFKESCDA